MHKTSDKHKRKGVLVVELAVSLTLISIIAGLTAVAMIRYRDVRSNFEWRRSAMALAVGQLVRYQAGADLDSFPPPGIVPDEITLTTEVHDGGGQWEGARLITVVATVNLPHRRSLVEKASGYIYRSERP